MQFIVVHQKKKTAAEHMYVFHFYVPVSESDNKTDPDNATYAVVKMKEKGTLHHVSSTLMLTCIHFLADKTTAGLWYNMYVRFKIIFHMYTCTQMQYKNRNLKNKFVSFYLHQLAAFS